MRQQHSPAHLFWRGVVAAGCNAAMATGLYPLLPHATAMFFRWRRGDPSYVSHAWAAATEWALSMAVVASRPVGFVGLPAAMTAGPRPVIVLHGYGMNRANFLLLAGRLGAEGMGPIVGFEYWSLGKVASAARRLGEFVDRVRAQSGKDRVDLVGHSMGGVVARYYVTLGGGDGRVRNLVTLGSPHGGTDASMWGFGQPTRELAPSSPLLDELARAPLPRRTRPTVIWSRSDPLVGTPACARWHGAEEIVYDDLGHLTLLASRRVTRDIAARLRDAGDRLDAG